MSLPLGIGHLETGLIFVWQNGQRADVSFLGTNGELPIGVALLLAAAIGLDAGQRTRKAPSPGRQAENLADRR